MVQFIGTRLVDDGIGTTEVVVGIANLGGELQASEPHGARNTTIRCTASSGFSAIVEVIQGLAAYRVVLTLSSREDGKPKYQNIKESVQ
jgi:hypothetical protein